MIDFLGKARKYKKKPVRLSDAQCEGLQQYLANECHKKLCKTAQKNQLDTPKSGGISLHTCCLIPMHEHRKHLVNEFARYFFNFNTVVWLVVDITLCGMYIEGTT